jgi:DNA-binding MarR family transcriptional regulator
MADQMTRDIAQLQELGRALWAAQHRRRSALDRELAAVGTTFPQWFALGEIARHPGSSAHWLAGKTFQSDQAFGTLANRLEAQGLIARAPGEGRKVAHHLTPAGEALLAAGNAIGDRMLDRSFGSLTAAERGTLRQLLDRVAATE